MSPPQVSVACVEDETEEEKDGGYTKDDVFDETDNGSSDGADIQRRDKGDQKSKGDQSAETQERDQPIALSILVRSAYDEYHEQDQFNDNVSDDLSPSIVGSESDESCSSNHGEDQGCKPEKVVFGSILSVDHTSRVEPPERGIQG